MSGNRIDPMDAPTPELVELARGLPPLETAVAHPCDAPSLAAAIEARRAGLIEPVLVGPEHRIRAIADREKLDLSGIAIEHAPHSHAAASRAVAVARQGGFGAIMKGSLHTDELMAEVLDRDAGLRTGRRVSHVYVMRVPGHPRLLLVTDAAINIRPTLDEKADIVRNAIDLAEALGIARPHVAILSAVETVTSKLQSTIDAAALCKMADRGQITGGVIDGPLAFDNAVSLTAAEVKGIESPVAGRADVLVAPDLEAGNILAKQLEYFARAEAAGIVVGARIPIILTSRSDSVATRVRSCALAVIHAKAQQERARWPKDAPRFS